jgi:hypothetical protein
MKRPLALLLSILAVTAGCTTSRPPLAEADGPYRVLNPGRWQPTEDDLLGVRPTPMQAATSNTPLRQP